MNKLKNQIAENFGKHAKEYDQAAQVQKTTIQTLVKELQKEVLPKGKLMELGSGTGLFSLELAKLYPKHSIHFTDLCPIMVEETKHRLQNKGGDFHFFSQDGETALPEKNYSAIFSSFAFQWFENLNQSILQLTKHLRTGGRLLVAMPSSSSYPEWKSACKLLNLPYGGNPLPDLQNLEAFLRSQNLSFQLWEESHEVRYASPLAFFHHFKVLGATTQTAANPLNYPDFKKLLKAMYQENGFSITTTTIILEIRKKP